MRESEKHGKVVRSLEEDVSVQEPCDEPKNREDGVNQFEKAKVHKSTLEAAISEVLSIELLNRTSSLFFL